jgi:hypothetical protein
VAVPLELLQFLDHQLRLSCLLLRRLPHGNYFMLFAFHFLIGLWAYLICSFDNAYSNFQQF